MSVRAEDQVSPLDPSWRAAWLVMSQVEIEADRERWLAERRGSPGKWRVTASEMPMVMGFSPGKHGSAFSVYYAKQAGVSTFEGSDRTDLGLALEPEIAARFAAAHPEFVTGAGGLWVSAVWPWLAATPDRVAFDVRLACDCPGGPDHPGDCPPGHNLYETVEPAGVVQLKTWAQRDDFGEPGTDEIPLHIRVQVLTEMAVLGAEAGFVPVMWLPSGKVDVFTIRRDERAEKDIAAIIKAGEEFIAALDSGVPPEPDWTPATTATLKALYQRFDPDAEVTIPRKLARRYHGAQRAKKEAERRLAQVQNEMRVICGTAGKLFAADPLTGEERLVASRMGGPRRGYSVAPKEWVEMLRPGPWGSGPKERPTALPEG